MAEVDRPLATWYPLILIWRSAHPTKVSEIFRAGAVGMEKPVLSREFLTEWQLDADPSGFHFREHGAQVTHQACGEKLLRTRTSASASSSRGGNVGCSLMLLFLGRWNCRVFWLTLRKTMAHGARQRRWKCLVV